MEYSRCLTRRLSRAINFVWADSTSSHLVTAQFAVGDDHEVDVARQIEVLIASEPSK